jgi:glycosyltransferase involved in cell wall biosynthesis
VVTPAFRCRACIKELHDRLTKILGSITEDYEIVFVDDASPEGDWEVIQAVAAADSRVKGIKLSRNFGQHYAITAGLDFASGEWVVVMDCDLQDQPDEIVRLYQKALEGYDMVLGIRQSRKDSTIKVLASRAFYRALEYLTDTPWDSRVGTFRILSRKVVENFRNMREQLRFFGGMIQWLGFKTARIDVNHGPRFAGESSYNLKSMLRLAVSATLSFSGKPLYLSVFIGLGISAGAFLWGLQLLIRKLFFGIPVAGWATLAVSLFFLSGLILFNLGVMGLYVGRIFIETKQRPLYVVDRTIGL